MVLEAPTRRKDKTKVASEMQVHTELCTTREAFFWDGCRRELDYPLVNVPRSYLEHMAIVGKVPDEHEQWELADATPDHAPL